MKHREFFDNFACFDGFDPLVARNWYPVTHWEIQKAGGLGLLYHFKDSHVKALISSYPELNLEESKFSSEDWKDVASRRKFFDDFFAHCNKFDPLDAKKWYKVTNREVTKVGGGGLLDCYKGSHIKALISLYPELNLQAKQFPNWRGYWKNHESQKIL